MSNRIDQLLEKIKSYQMDSILITSPANVYYVSNYYTDPHERVIGVYLNPKHDPLLILPAMEASDAKAAGWTYDIVGYYDQENPWSLFLDYLKKHGNLPQSLGLEHDQITLERYHEISNILPHTQFLDAKELLASLRNIKNKKEYALLKQAAALADLGVEIGIKSIKEGITEVEIIATIEYELKKQGIMGMSFSTMTLSGTKTASPHGTPGSKKIEKGDLVMFDLGVIYEGYCSDITRTVAFHSISKEQEKIYNTVLAAQQKAIAASQIGTAVGEIDKAARKHIEAAGYGEYFNHRIGHGLGIETHEYPSMHGNNKLSLQAGMCYTIEPGIYVPNVGGVRIEDMIFTTDKGAEVLTKSPKDLQIIN